MCDMSKYISLFRDVKETAKHHQTLTH